MSEESAPDLGPRIRAIREQRGFSLRTLAERCGLSVNAISLIERGTNSPSIATLHKLATALEIRLTDLFERPEEHAVVFSRRDARLSARGPGVLMESLGIGLRDQQIEPFLVTVTPDEPSSDGAVIHGGQEFVYCLSGNVRYRVGTRTYDLEPGDSLLFEASLPHEFWSSGESAAQILLVFEARDGGNLARRRHLGS